MLQYALLHLFGYALTIDDLKAFRVSFLESAEEMGEEGGDEARWP